VTTSNNPYKIIAVHTDDFIIRSEKTIYFEAFKNAIIRGIVLSMAISLLGATLLALPILAPIMVRYFFTRLAPGYLFNYLVSEQGLEGAKNILIEKGESVVKEIVELIAAPLYAWIYQCKPCHSYQ